MLILSSFVVVSQLVRLSDVLLAFGVTLENILLPFLFLYLPFLGVIIPLAFLGAVIISFARLSADGEYAAMLATGRSLWRTSIPVLISGFALYIVAALGSMFLEPWGRREFEQFYIRKTQTEIDNFIRFKMESGVFIDNFLGFVLYSEHMTEDRSRMDNVMLAPRAKKKSSPTFTLVAPVGSISGSVEGGDLQMGLNFGTAWTMNAAKGETSVIRFQDARIDLLRMFKDRIFEPEDDWEDYRSYYPVRFWQHLKTVKASRKGNTKSYWRPNYLFHNRIASPFSIMAFAMFAMVIGIQDQRHGRNRAYAGGIATIIFGYVLMMGAKWLAERGHAPAIVCAWAPQLLMTAAAAYLVYQRSRLPISESTLAPRYIPWIGSTDRIMREASKRSKPDPI